MPRRLFLARSLAVGAGALALGTAGAGVVAANSAPVVRRVPIRIPGLDPGLAGLRICAWTLRPENAFLPLHLRRGADLAGQGDLQTEIRLLFALGIDGVITDSPDAAVRARAELSAVHPAVLRTAPRPGAVPDSR